MTYGLLGDFYGKVHVDPTPSDLVYVRVDARQEKDGAPKLETIVVRNKGVVANVYGTPVNIQNGEVTSMWNFR